ncbi:oxalate decarboxylase [Microdochium bolleyi]|uniref:Oxalate decarboxylase n=1 Tax=Microdochium bolleyi TaxID=196109 RepID=A0A136IQA9_9PEZI|nr:oxalate decarboxylase [Microdochium bolleyi]
MRLPSAASALLALSGLVAAAVVERKAGFSDGQPISADGKGAPILGGTDNHIDVQNPDNLGQQSTDSGVVPNLKWRFSDSKNRIFKGGWSRQSVITDLPSSRDIAGAQQHLTKGSIRELHWHRVAEWGYVYAGSVLVSAVDHNGKYQVAKLEVGDVWYFPPGEGHTVQGLDDENEFLLVFDDGDFDARGTTFNVDDWIARTPRHILAKNFGLPAEVFSSVPATNPTIQNGNISTSTVTGGAGELSGNASFVYYAKDHELVSIPGGGGTLRIIDTTTFPASKTIAATVVTLSPGSLRELHWHPNAEEWLYFHKGKARATVFLGTGLARTFDFAAGDTGVFPSNSGHYIENISEDEDLVWIEIYKSDRVLDNPLTQWLALTPADLVAQVLRIPLDVAQGLKKDKQILVKG